MPRPKPMDLSDTIDYILEPEVHGHLFIGIDPGAEGAIAIITDRRIAVASIPTFKIKRSGGTKTEFDLPEIHLAMERIQTVTDTHTALEEALVQIKGKGANAYTGFRVGVGFGMWPLYLTGLGLSFERVHPAVWKRQMGLLGKDKEASRLKAMSLFPKVDLNRKCDHNKAEALLLAEWMRRRINGEK